MWELITTLNSIFNLSSSDGLPDMGMIERGALIMPDGTAYFATAAGLVYFNVHDFKQKPETLTFTLVGFKMNGKEMRPQPTFSYNQNYLTFRFSALNYAAPEHTHYRYRLLGLDHGWLTAHDEGGLSTAIYNALPPGKYIFEAQAAVADGKWGSSLQLPITILPPWWMTWWMKLFYGLIALSVLISLINFYLKRKRLRLKAEAEEQVNRMFEVRDEARHHFAQQLDISPDKLAMNLQEEELVTRLMDVINRHISDADYSVEQMASDMAMDRTGLYRKLQTIVGITPSEFLRSVRLKHAAHLLTETSFPVTEISERVGFNTPRIFSSNFKKMFGVTPSEYRVPLKVDQ